MNNRNQLFSSMIDPFASVSTVTTMSSSPPSTVCRPSTMSKYEKGFGRYMAVLPEYDISNGREAIVGRINLYRHFKSSVSSINPKNIMKQIENNAELYVTKSC